MSLTAAMIDAMVESGCTVEQMAAVMKAALAGDEARKAKKRENDAARQRKSRANRSVSHSVTVTECDERDAVPPNDNISNPPPLDAKASCPPLADRVVEAWNEGPGSNGAPKARPLDGNRRKLLSLRTREHSETEVFEAIRNVGASEFHCGKNDRGWTANLGWLLKSPENFQKALEMGTAQQARAGPAEPINLAQRILQREQQRAQA